MARKPRVEIEGGLYHIITRGNHRQVIFHSDDDYQKFLLLLGQQKAKLPFYLYAYCLMPNHIHLLIERRGDAISRLMHRLLSGYSQYHNRKYQKVGHLFQSRYKGILCQTDQYLAELVRYIRLNPVRAKIVRKPEAFRYSGHRAYVGLDKPGPVDVDPVLRHFGATKKLARERFELFVRAGIKLGHREEFYRPEEGRILGSEEFVEETKNRVGEIPRGARPQTEKRSAAPDLRALTKAVEEATGLKSAEFFSDRKNRAIVLAKEALIVVGREMNVSNGALSQLIGIDSSVASRRFDSAKKRMTESGELRKLVKQVRAALNSRQA